MTRAARAACAAFALAACVAVAAAASPPPASYTADQAWQGRLTYYAHCAECHGGGLGGNIGPALAGGDDRTQYETGADVYAYVATHMPHGNPGGLSATEYVNVMAFLYQQHHRAPGKRPLTAATLAADATKLGP